MFVIAIHFNDHLPIGVQDRGYQVNLICFA
jgi:hypothetical protein